ncbi:MAG TPA: multiheme c-type cytochrome, partial [Armatimonadota bacterium]|nr:multiheme c-type cytochrome [Armatimonadota bacterium]
HSEQFQQQSATNHARTLRLMDRDRLPAGFPSSAEFTDPGRGASYSMREADGRFALSVTGRPGTLARTLDLALGSGKRGMTFLSLEGPESMIEMRLSCFPRQGKWFITPGQGGPDAPLAGKLHEGEDARRCIGCHAVTLPEAGVAPEARFMGVGCESCHGPGKAHVAAAAGANPKPGAIRILREVGATQLNELCGKCHRTAKDIDLENEVATQQTQRFQPYGLMKSQCFIRSGDRLSCVTCHDPHRNVETRPAAYERACLSCHGSNKTSAASQTVCPVNPRGGCVGCHMPQRALMPGISMADHYIRVFPSAKGIAPTAH